MISVASIDSIGLGNHYEYNDTHSAPTEIGPMVGDWSSYKMLGSESYTAKEIHNNMRIMYDKIGEKFYNSLADETIKKQPGLSISTLDNTTSEDFLDAVPSADFMIESVIIPKGQSVELSGYFIPSTSGVYQFLSSGNSIDSWIGDVAIYEYTDSNRTVNQKELRTNYCYAVRFQAKNEGENNLPLTISVTCNGELVSKPEFVTLFKNGDRYERELLYYGLIYNYSNGKYYCYYDDKGAYDMIIESKYKTALEMTTVLQSDTAPSSTTSSINDGQQTTLASSTSAFDVNVNSASYTTRPTYEYVTATRNVIDWDNAYEYYTYTGTKWVYVWRNGRRVRVQQQYAETKKRKKNHPPTKAVQYKQRIKIPSQRVNVIGEVNSAAGTTIQPSDVTSARNGTLTVKTTSTVKPNIAKSISMDTSGNVVATYNNTTPVVLFPTSGQNSSKTIQINNDGSVTAGNAIWHNPMSTSAKSTAITNNIWKARAQAQGSFHTLGVGNPLTTIISPDSRFKLEMSPDSKLRFTYCIQPYVEIGTVKFSTALNQSLYLYRPKYNRLGGKMYIQTIPGNKLIQVKSNDNTLQFSSFSSVSGGYPLFPKEYENKTATPAECRELCQNEPNCGNYVTYGNSGCMLDGTYNNKPNYSKSSKISTPNIYIKKYKMSTESDPVPVAFTQIDSSGFSGYTIINDVNKPQTEPATTTDTSLIDAKSNLSNVSFNLNQLTSEPFQGQGRDIPARFLNTLPETPDSSVEEGRIDDLQMILFQQNVLYSLSSIAALTFLASAIVLAHK